MLNLPIAEIKRPPSLVQSILLWNKVSEDSVGDRSSEGIPKQHDQYKNILRGQRNGTAVGVLP